jgi:hypothetical protein
MRKLLIDTISSLGAKWGEKRKPLRPQRFVFLPVALPHAYEVSCRAGVWKYPIHDAQDIEEYAP